MTPAGKRDRRIVFQRFTATQDEYGEQIETWAQQGASQKAAVFYGRGDERREAAREEGSQTANFNCHATETTRAIIVRDRIVMDGENWDILGVSPMGRREIEFTAQRSL